MKTYIKKRDWTIITALLFLLLITGSILFTLVEQIHATPVFISFAMAIILVAIMYLLRREEAINIYEHDNASNYKQIEALFNLFTLFDFKYPLPTMRNWAISPDAALIVVKEVMDRQPDIIVECGSGVTTVLIAKTLKNLGKGKLYSIDHDEHYAFKTKQMLDRHSVSEYVEIIVAPLKPTEIKQQDYLWYDLDKLKIIPEKIDVLLIDGPPGKQGAHARYPAFHVLAPRTKESGIIIMDDYIRNDEKIAVQKWLKDSNQYSLEHINTEKEIAILRATLN